MNYVTAVAVGVAVVVVALVFAIAVALPMLLDPSVDFPIQLEVMASESVRSAEEERKK